MRRKKIPERAVDFILSSKNEDLRDIKVHEVARKIKANRSYLSRAFKKEQRLSITGFISREKVYRALFILDKDQQKPIEELSQELGFNRIEDFVLEFKKHIAIDPVRYRDIKKQAKDKEPTDAYRRD